MPKRSKGSKGRQNGNSKHTQDDATSSSQTRDRKGPRASTEGVSDPASIEEGPVASSSRSSSHNRQQGTNANLKQQSDTYVGDGTSAISELAANKEDILNQSHSQASSSTTNCQEVEGTDAQQDETNGHETEKEAEDEDEDEDEDEEPTLRYNRFGSKSLADILQKDTCSCLTASDKYLVLGSHNGLVTIFARPGYIPPKAGPSSTPSKGKEKALEKPVEYEGEYIVKKYRAHQAAIMDIVIDEDSQFIGTASMDGKVVTYQLATNDAQAFDLKRPLRCLAFEPSYASRSTRQLVSGGMAGSLTLHEKGWLGPKDVVLHSGEGPIWSVQWHRNYIAWANDKGVRLYDTHSSTRFAFIPRAEDSPRADLYPCYLLWQNDTRLIIGWADFVRVVDIRDRKYQQDLLRKQQEEKDLVKASNTSIGSGGSVKSIKSMKPSIANPLSGMGAYIPSLGTGNNAVQATYAEVTNVLQLDCMISGIVPFVPIDDFSVGTASEFSTERKPSSHQDTTAFVILSYPTIDGDGDSSTFTTAAPSSPPELQIVDIESSEELSSDVLSISRFERYQCRDYRIVAARSGIADQAVYFASSPSDLIEVQKRDVWDHLAWLCEHGKYEQALKVVQAEGIRGEPNTRSSSNRSLEGRKNFSIQEIGKNYLEHLFEQNNYEAAARNMTSILGQDSKRWEHWIFQFQQRDQLAVAIPYIPTSQPLLDHVVYELVLLHYLRTDPAILLQTLKTWSTDLYEEQAIINSIEDTLEGLERQTNVPDTRDILMECLVEIYTRNRQPARALPYYLRLRKTGVFDLIRQHNLFSDIHYQALLLVDFQEEMKRRKALISTRDKRGAIEKENVEAKHGEAIELLVDHTQSVPIARVVAQLSKNKYYLYMYLDALFTRDPQAAFEYSDALVELYAEHEYPRLLDFLRASTSYSLEQAFNICKAQDYVPEMVFLLGRMGNNKEALMLIIERLGDVQRAIEFVKEQNDGDLWEDLLKYAESRPRFIRGLLENVGPEVDPIRLIRRIKNGLDIPGLKPAIIKILQDFNIQISLIDGCRTILNTDCRRLTLELYDGQTNATLGSLDASMCYKCHKPVFRPPNGSNSSTASATTGEATSILFLCRHTFHITCALPDVDLPSRPQHFLNPLLSDKLSGYSDCTGELERSRQLAAKILFASQLKSRAAVPVSCPACLAGKGSRLL